MGFSLSTTSQRDAADHPLECIFRKADDELYCFGWLSRLPENGPYPVDIAQKELPSDPIVEELEIR